MDMTAVTLPELGCPEGLRSNQCATGYAYCDAATTMLH